MKRFLLISCLLFCSIAGISKHIVGGEFQWLRTGIAPDGRYIFSLSMILYRDAINGRDANGTKIDDPFADVAIFRKSDNKIMLVMGFQTIRLDKISDVRVPYKRNDCGSSQFIDTDRIVYEFQNSFGENEILLDPDDFDDPGGYYISWQRCCRNYQITNIFSIEPTQPDPTPGDHAGQTFYLEFPPLSIPNSSPYLFPPLTEFACPNLLYIADFGGTDPDGDSLVYSMEEPLSTSFATPLPPNGVPQAGPYPTVSYRIPFSQDNIIDGNPDLTISARGRLTGTPSKLGLFVFAVKCEEFRDGVKIGEIRRDFQLLVRDCAGTAPPIVEAKKKTETTFQRNNLSLTFGKDATDEERCIDVRITDPDATSKPQDIELSIIGVGFKDYDLNDVLPEDPKVQLSNGQAAAFSICFPQCPYTKGLYTVDVLAINEGCGGARLDTIRVAVNVVLPPNSAPVYNPSQVVKEVTEGGAPYEVLFTATDADNDVLQLVPPKEAKTDFALYGFSYVQVKNVAGEMTHELRWDTRCDVYDFSVRRDFEFTFLARDRDYCDITPDTPIKFNLKRRIPDLHDPLIEYLPAPTLKKFTIQKKIYESLNFNVRGSDEDVNDNLSMFISTTDFNPANVGLSFPSKTFKVEATTPLDWYLNCDKMNVLTKDTYQFYLIVKSEESQCPYQLADTLDITVKVSRPDNQTPFILINNEPMQYETTLTLGEELSLPVNAFDADNAPSDRITLTLNDTGVLPEGVTFSEASGTSPVTGMLKWKPDCSIFKNGVYENEYKFQFKAADNRCFNPRSNTYDFTLKVKDIESVEGEFTPPNVITPRDVNGKNDYFAMEKLVDGQLVSILPLDNCQGQFVDVTIFNRWGRKVFENGSRDFKWYADEESGGVYYYILKFSNREYKGTVSVVTASESGNR